MYVKLYEYNVEELYIFCILHQEANICMSLAAVSIIAKCEAALMFISRTYKLQYIQTTG